MAGLFDFLQSPDASLGINLLAAAAPTMQPMGFGQRLAMGLQATRDQQQAEQDRAMRKLLLDAQLQQFADKSAQSKQAREVQQQFMEDMNKYGIGGFTPEMRAKYQLAGINVEDIYKSTVGKPAEFGLDPKVAINPDTNKPEFYVQGRDGKTKWLGMSPPPDYQVFPPTDYRGPGFMDKRNPSAGVQYSEPPTLPGQQTAPAGGAPIAGPRQVIPGIVSPKIQDEARAQEYKDAQKRLNELRDALQTGSRTLTDLEKFGQLNQANRTGGFDDLLGISKFNPITADAAREMEAITARLTPTQRPPGSGATSDYEMRQYRLGIPSIDNPGPANKAIREQFKSNLDLGRQELAFKEAWLAQNGTLNGADEAWSKKVEEARSGGDKPKTSGKTVVRTGVYQGRKVVQYSDGSYGYAD